MKLNRILTPAIALAALGLTTAHADVLAQWTFETSAPTTAGPFAPELGLQTGTAQATESGFGTVSSPTGNGSARAFSGNGWDVNDYFQFTVNTLGYQDITLSWDQSGSNTGPRDFGLFYSINGGSYIQTGIASPNYTVLANASPNTPWSSSTYNAAFTLNYNLSAINTIENINTLAFRLVDLSTTAITGGTVAAAGTDRLDNFTVNASPVPEPSTFAMALGGFGVLASYLRRRKQ